MSASRRADQSEIPQHDSQDFDSILSKAKSGDSEAMGYLFDICQKYLLLIANQDLNPKIMGKFGASDVVQQTMLIANTHLLAFRGNTKGEFLTWMKTILVNECRQSSRRYAATAKRSVTRDRSMVSETDRDAAARKIWSRAILKLEKRLQDKGAI